MHSLAPLCVSALLCLSSAASAQEESFEDEMRVLSPFIVVADDADGYQATSTLAGTRLKTDLRDIGSAIQVITEAVFEDTGATDAESVLSYGLNTEVAGVHGNFADGLGSNNNGRAEQDLQRTEPQSAQRIRGLAKASLTRNFFLTDIPFDSYNTSRIDISRGANSLLFGIGAPGGIIDNSLRQASAFGKNQGKVGIRVGERGSYRATVDYHRVVIDDRLAVRVCGLYDDTQYQQRPAYEVDKRFYAAFEGVLFRNDKTDFLGATKVRGNFEIGSIFGTPPIVVPPSDGFTSFFVPPDVATLQTVPGVVIPGYYTGKTEPARFHPEFGITEWNPKQTYDTRLGLNRENVPAPVERPVGPSISLVYPDHNSDRASITTSLSATTQALSGQARNSISSGITEDFNYLGSGSFFMGAFNGQAIPNFTTPVIMNPDIWDNQNRMIQGRTNRRQAEFEAYSVALEQSLFNYRGGFEFAFDRQIYEQDTRLPFSFDETIGETGNGDVVIDVSEYLSDGSPNPNLGRPMMKQKNVPTDGFRSTEREAIRATLFYTLDFEELGDGKWSEWLGQHTFTGFYNEQQIENFSTTHRGRWISDTIDLREYSRDIRFFRRSSTVWAYVEAVPNPRGFGTASNYTEE